MKYSIITPVKQADINKLPLLKANLDKQGTSDLEWLLIGDQAVADIPWEASSYSIKPIVTDTSLVGGARNLGVAAATGDYLVFVDADDLLVPDTLNKYWPVIEQFDVIDLRTYPTYEPAHAFLNSAQTKQNSDNLPSWGGRGRKRHKDWHQLNLLPDNQIKVADTTIDTDQYQQWLTAKYTTFSDQRQGNIINSLMRVAGKVISRKLITETKATSATNSVLFSDYHFMLTILNHCQTVARLVSRTYIKVRHNDPINDPSVTQVGFAAKWQDRLTTLTTELPLIQQDYLKQALIQTSLKRIHRFFYKGLVSETSATDRPALLAALQAFLNQVPTTDIKQLGGVSRRILMKVRKGNLDAAFRQMKRVILARYLKMALVKHGRGLPRAVYQYVFTKLPIKSNVIIYESFLGRNYSDNPKYVYEYIRDTYPGQYKHVWSVAKGATVDIPKDKNTIKVKRFGFRYMYYLAVSRYQVMNMRQQKSFIKRPGTTFLETWHGTPLKHLVFDLDNVALASSNPLYKQIFYKQTQQWDYLVAANQFSVDVFEHAFIYPKDKMIKSGYPRNDILNAPDKETRKVQIKAKLNIPADKKVILYAPTWRDDEYYGVGEYKFSLKLDIPRLKEELGDEYVLVLRTHYFVVDHLDTSGFGDFVFNESSYDDIAELYLISDLLITDYSSVFFDYAVLKRPILYYVYDYEKYGSVLRGFYLNMEKDLPGPLLKTNDEVLDAIRNIDTVSQEYQPRYQEFNERFNAWEDGHASQRVVNTLFQTPDNQDTPNGTKWKVKSASNE